MVASALHPDGTDYYPHTVCGRGLSSTMHQLQPLPPPYSRTQPLAALNSGLLLSANNSLPNSLIRCASCRGPESLISRFALSSLISPQFALSSRHLLICQDWRIHFLSIFEVFFRHSASPSSIWAASGAARMALRKHKFEDSLSFLSHFGNFFLTRLSFLTEPHKI